MKTLQKGFTLIELLVVIAIIGILSSIVLASLSSARSKGTDAAIQSTISNMRAQTELFYSNNGGYATTTGTNTYATASCSLGIFGDTGVGGLSTLMASLIKSSGTGNVYCTSSSTAWAVAAKLTSNAGSACADSTGQSISSSTLAVASAVSGGVCVK